MRRSCAFRDGELLHHGARISVRRMLRCFGANPTNRQQRSLLFAVLAVSASTVLYSSGLLVASGGGGGTPLLAVAFGGGAGTPPPARPRGTCVRSLSSERAAWTTLSSKTPKLDGYDQCGAPPHP